ncbi:MAG: hypothetical protein M4579_003674 [Chaenotheca gracillima]|nr:MAG: hypothetical protein M4579_003674 [Chaenotheca gracillima]
MADYNNLKVPELKKLLQDRSLPVSGNKAELITRLHEHDTSSSKPALSTSAQPAAATTIAPPAEEEIDWDDDDAPAAATEKPTSDASAAALAAGGKGQVPNPAAVPNQKLDVDPTATSDLTATKPAANGTATGAEAVSVPAATAAATGTEEATTEAKTSTPAPPPVDFTAGVAATSLEEEIKKRQARAKRFNVQETEEESIRALERTKRFGTGTAGEQAAGTQSSNEGVKGLDQALPERRQRKRGREGGNDTEGGAKRRDFGGRGGRGQRNGRGGGGARGDRNSRSGSRPQRGGGALDDPSERAKAEARAKKFAPSAATA